MEVTRRDFVKTSAAMAASAAASFASPRAFGATDRVRVGFIGVGMRGGQLIDKATTFQDVQVVAVCDVSKTTRDKWVEHLGSGVTPYNDFRELIARNDIDAVFVATPEHWHAIQMITACRAGKDVYVEKPMSYTIHEGRRMVEVAKETNRIVQIGLQRRSSKLYAQLRQLVQDGKLGKINTTRAYKVENMYPKGIGKSPDGDPPAGFDWDLWLGPRPARKFNPDIVPYKFRWWKEYSSQMANWGVHYFDYLRWITNDEAPSSVCTMGGKFVIDDNRTIPDTMEAIFEMPSGRLMLFTQNEASGNPWLPKGTFRGADAELRGPLGTVLIGDDGIQVIQEKGGQFQADAPLGDALEVKASEGDLATQHVRNFLDCVKSRQQPNCPPEEGHRSTTFAHLGNISLAVKSRIEWDAKTERITNNEEANKLLHYEYRAPWKLE